MAFFCTMGDSLSRPDVSAFDKRKLIRDSQNIDHSRPTGRTVQKCTGLCKHVSFDPSFTDTILESYKHHSDSSYLMEGNFAFNSRENLPNGSLLLSSENSATKWNRFYESDSCSAHDRSCVNCGVCTNCTDSTTCVAFDTECVGSGHETACITGV